MKHFKFLTAENKGPFSGFDFTPFLPKRGKPGRWLPKVDTLDICKSGYHVCREGDLIEWLNARCYEVEIRGDKMLGDNKTVAQQMRFIRLLNLDDVSLRLFAADCAERVLPNFEKQYPGDSRPRRAIQAARDFALGKIDDAAAANDAGAAHAAAGGAARYAASYAATSASYAATSAFAAALAASAASYAASNAATSAAYAASNAATSAAYAAADEERRWQNRRLKKYMYGKIRIERGE